MHGVPANLMDYMGSEHSGQASSSKHRPSVDSTDDQMFR